MDVPTSESVINWPFPTSSGAIGPYAKGQGIYLAGDLRQAQSDRGSYFMQDAERGNPDTAFMKQTSLGKLVGYNNQLPYYGNINWSNNVTGRGVRSTSTQQVSMRDLSNYTVSNTVKEAFGSFGQYNAHSSSASPIRTYLASETIRSWVTASYQTASYGTLGVFAYKNNINRPRMGAFIQNRSRETDVLSGPDTASMFNTAVINYGVPTITGSNGGDLNFNVVPTVSSIGLSNTAESVTVTIPNRVSWPGNGNFDGDSAYLSQKRQGLLVYSNLGGDSGKLYYNRYLVSSSNPNGLSLALEVGSTTKLPNNDRNYCVLGLVEEYSFGYLFDYNFRVPNTFSSSAFPYYISSDMSSANILYTQGLGWYSYIVSMTGSILYTGSRAYLGSGYPLNWRNENGAQMKQGFAIVGSQDFPGSTGSADDKIVLSYITPEYNPSVSGPDYSSWVSNPSGSWYDYNTPIITTIISGSKKWQSKAIENLGNCGIQNSLSTGSVVLAAMAHTGSSIDIGLYMLTGSGFIQLDYLAGVGSGNVDSTDRITLYKLGGGVGNYNYMISSPNPSGILGSFGGTSYYTYASSSWDASLPLSYYISSSAYVGLTYTTNDINPSTKIVYLRIDMAHLKFINTTSLPTDSYGPYASLGGGYNYFFAGFPMGRYYDAAAPIVIGWEDPRGLPGNGASAAGYNPQSIVPIVPIVGSYYDSNAGTSEIKMSSIALY